MIKFLLHATFIVDRTWSTDIRVGKTMNVYKVSGNIFPLCCGALDLVDYERKFIILGL